jgi:hypothetical protein
MDVKDSLTAEKKYKNDTKKARTRTSHKFRPIRMDNPTGVGR